MLKQETTEDSIEVRNFQTFVPLMKSVDVDPETGDYVVSGPVASEQQDLEGDTMVRSGIWKSLVGFFRDYGAHIDWEHKYVKDHDPKWIIGRGKDAINVDGRPYLAARLFKANPLVESIVTLIKSGSRLGYSVLGTGVRDRATKMVMPTSIKFVTIAPVPMGVDQFIQLGSPDHGIVQISKALCCDNEKCESFEDSWHNPSEHEIAMIKAFTTGAGIVTAGSTGGAAVRVQQLGAEDDESRPCGCTRKKKCEWHSKESDSALQPVTAIEKALHACGVVDFRDAALELTMHIRNTRNGI